MNDDPSLEVFAEELRREWVPVAPSSRLTRAVAAELSWPAATPSLARRSWARWLEPRGNVRLAWAGAGVLLATAALGAFRPDFSTRSQPAPLAAVVRARTEPSLSPALAAMEPVRSPAPEASSDHRDAPIVLRSHREFVDTLRWRDRRTGARLEVRYPRAEFVFASAEPF